MIRLLPIVVFALLLSFCAPLTVYASTGQETVEEDMHGRFCDANPNDFSFSQEDRDQSDGDGIVGGVDDEDNVGEQHEPNPYCDTDKGKSAPVCHDRKDYSQSTGLYPCNDGTNKVDWRDCKDATDGDNVGEEKSRDNDGVEDEVITENDESCYDEGYEDGQNGPFNKLMHSQCEGGNGDNDYYIGFRLGCTNAGNTIDVCESAADK